MSDKHILVQSIERINGSPVKIADWNEDGEVIFIDTEDDTECLQEDMTKERAYKVRTKDADTLSMVENIILTPPEGTQAKKDGTVIPNIWQAICNSRGNGQKFLILKDDDWDWLKRHLNRDIPMKKVDKDAGFEIQTIAMKKFGVDADYIVNQLLTDVDMSESVSRTGDESESSDEEKK